MPEWQLFIVSHSNPTTVTVLELFMGVTNGFGSPFVFGVQIEFLSTKQNKGVF